MEDVLGRFMGAMEWWAYGFLHIRLNFRLAEMFFTRGIGRGECESEWSAIRGVDLLAS